MNKKQIKNSPNHQVNSKNKKKLVLGVTGGIAAYKSAGLVRRLKDVGFDVRVVMTQSAQEFITPMTMQALSGLTVFTDLFDCQSEAAMGHIELAKWADILLIAPATANMIAKIAHGMADDLLSTIVLASKARLIVCPSMNQQMWANSVVKNNIKTLVKNKVEVIEPESGEQACGDIGQGRMPEAVDIAMYLSKNDDLARDDQLKGKNIVITAGPTQESLDPVRYLSNHSSGKMGYALAKVANDLGANVTLISGPVTLTIEDSINLVKVRTAQEMLMSVKDNIKGCDIFIGCAAVADYRPKEVSEQKIKKDNDNNEMTLSFVKNPDVLKWVSENRSKHNQGNKTIVVGFAAESENLKAFALNKLEKKKLDMICANDISQSDFGFNSENNKMLLLTKDGQEIDVPAMTKIKVAEKIIESICHNF